MNSAMRSDLRVYIHPSSASTAADSSVFYSRRSSGPLYRWSFEQEPRQWRSSRVNQSFSVLKKLCVASWIAVPPALQARLDEHYLE
jgi:hypothetical protein